MRKRWTFGAAVVLAVAAASTAFATIPSADGVIHGCFKQFAGTLRLVEGGESCSAKERPIAWNARGPKGDTGPVGPQGPAGPRGPAADFGTGAGLEKLELHAPPPIGDQTLLQIEQGYRLPQGCSAGAVPQRSGNGWVCGSGSGAGQAILRAQGADIGVDSNTGAVPVTAELPAGAWAVTATGSLENPDREAVGSCALRRESASGPLLDYAGVYINDTDYLGDGSTITLVGVVNLPAPGQLVVECDTPHAGVEATSFDLLAIRVGSLG